MRTIAVFTVLAVLSLALLTSCSDDEVTNNNEPEYSRATPEGLFAALAYALEEEEIDIYGECLHDEYLFRFLPGDADSAGLPPDEPWWGKTEDVTAILNIFEAVEVTRVQCDLTVVTGPWAVDDGSGYRLEPDFKVTIEHAGATEPLTMWVNNSWLDVEVTGDPYEDDKWVFRSIEEVFKGGVLAVSTPGPVLMTEASTFGGIKAIFFSP